MKSCIKQSYPSKKAAKDAAKFLEVKYGRSLYQYYCSKCKAIHLSTNPIQKDSKL